LQTVPITLLTKKGGEKLVKNGMSIIMTPQRKGLLSCLKKIKNSTRKRFLERDGLYL
jgi:hypothetical protein